jgi:hypothetical protein
VAKGKYFTPRRKGILSVLINFAPLREEKENKLTSCTRICLK